MEPLESRQLLAAVIWSGAGDGTSWNNPYNWSPQGVPTAEDAVVIDDATKIATIRINEDVSVASIDSNEILEIDNATLQVASVDALAIVLKDSTLTSMPQQTLSVSVEQDLIVDAGSHLSVDGLGYSGGSDIQDGSGPGGGQYQYQNAGGGSHAGRGGIGTNGLANSGPTYGSADEIRQPTDFGSGGGSVADACCYWTGGAGGGAIRIDVDGTLQVDGRITANGENGNEGTGGGAGGSVWITPGRLIGSGSIEANGGGSYHGGGGGGGRIAVHDGFQSEFQGMITAHGGIGSASGRSDQIGGAGTVFHQNDLIIDHGGLVGGWTELAEPLDFGWDIIVRGGAVLGTPEGVPLELSADRLIIEADGAISADGRGHVGGLGGSGGLGPGGGTHGYQDGSGASHAGRGGNGVTAVSGATYGSILEPTEFGSGGSGSSGDEQYDRGGAGGGAIRLQVYDLQVDGVVSANGLFGRGGGAGGSIWITTGGIEVNGVIQANGGDAYGGSGGGGGGRVAIEYRDDQTLFPNSPTWDHSGVAAQGGNGHTNGGAGSIHLEHVAVIRQSQRSTYYRSRFLFFDNGDTEGGITELAEALTYNDRRVEGDPGSSRIHSNRVIVGGNAILAAPDGQSLSIQTEYLTVLPDGHISADGRGFAGGEQGAVGEGPGGGAFIWDGGGGGSHAGRGGVAKTPLRGITYGSITEPTTFGSGGGTGNSVQGGGRGGSGGGAIRIETRYLDVGGKISADGESGNAGGAGGSVWITTDSLFGEGEIQARGGAGGAGGGGGGRVAIDYRNLHDRVDENDVWQGSINAYGGAGGYDHTLSGAGTVYMNDRTEWDFDGRTLIIDHGGTQAGVTELAEPVKFDGNVIVRGGGVLGTMHGAAMDLWVYGDVIVEADGEISADGRGYVGGLVGANGEGPAGGNFVYDSGGGGSHGGVGDPGKAVASGPAYGSITEPVTFGSGGGAGIHTPGDERGGDGGGAIRLRVGGTLDVSGSVSANGLSGSSGDGGGAGGSLWISAGQIDGPGTISANGGNGSGAGGGGRVAVYTVDDLAIDPMLVTAIGGDGGLIGAENGTVHLGTLAPPPAVEISLKPESDTGYSDSDRITNTYDLTFEITLPEESRLWFQGYYATVEGRTSTWRFGGSTYPAGPISKLIRFGSYLDSSRIDYVIGVRALLESGGAIEGEISFVVDPIGATITDTAANENPSEQVLRNLETVDVVFDSEIDPSTFTTEDVTLTGPSGVVPTDAPLHVEGNTWRIGFANQSEAGDYTLQIGTDVMDLAGNPLNQDGDRINGEADEDVFTQVFTIEAPKSIIIEGSGETLSLSDEMTDLVGVGMIDLRGSGDNTLVLDAVRMQTAFGREPLLVVSDPGDNVVFDDGWQFTQATMMDGQVVRQFAHEETVVNLVGPDDFTNPLDRHDVNGADGVSPIDALLIINHLARTTNSDGDSSDVTDLASFRFYDVNSDNRFSPLDALHVINDLARSQASLEGEIIVTLEAIDDPDSVSRDFAEPEPLTISVADNARKADGWALAANDEANNPLVRSTATHSDEPQQEDLVDEAVQMLLHEQTAWRPSVRTRTA